MKRRLNVTIPTEYYEALSAQQLNLSGLITGLLGDHLAGNTITISVSKDTKRLYDQVIANTGYSDVDVEKLLRAGLELLLERQIAKLEQLRQKVESASDEEDIATLRKRLRKTK